MIFNVFKENCPRDRKIDSFDSVCRFQRGHVIDDCCLLWKSFGIIGSVWTRHLTQLNPKRVSAEKNIVCFVRVS